MRYAPSAGHTDSTPRRTRVFASGLLAVFAAVAVGAAVPSAAAREARGAATAERSVVVFFTRGEQLATAKRDVREDAALDETVARLLDGPTREERSRGLRSSIPSGVALNSTSVNGNVATVDVSRAFTVGSRQSLQARLAQLVFTATQFEGVASVRIAVDGRLLPRLGEVALDPPPGRRAFLPTPEGGAPPPVPTSYPEPTSLVRAVQERLIELSYLPPRSADGIAGPQTRQAILAFQGWRGLARDGRATRALRSMLASAERPRPRDGAGRHIEVDLARQVALLVDRGRVVRAVHVSTGAPSSATPRGSYTVFRKETRSWSVPFRIWLPYASYFTGGIAFHESADVPAYPASHGCVRVPASDARAVYAFASMGTRVVVH